jgi:hypothetical protein
VLFDTGRRAFPAIDLREEQQLALLPVFATYCAQQPWTDEPSPPRRYFFRNDFYSYADALSLYCWIRHARPLRLVEVGSGYSSCVSLDTNELFFGDSIACTFVEPHPEQLRGLLRPGDEARVRIVEKPLQDVEPEVFRELGADDILFVDSTHVSRIGSDVHTLPFEILPALRLGVSSTSTTSSTRSSTRTYGSTRAASGRRPTWCAPSSSSTMPSRSCSSTPCSGTSTATRSCGRCRSA